LSEKKRIFVSPKIRQTLSNPKDTKMIEEKIVQMLRTVYDPEIPVNVYDLGLIYNIDVDDEKNVSIEMTLTAPNCPAADFIIEDIRIKIESIEEVKSVDIKLVFEPEWDKDMMSEEAKLELGFL
jgi:Predicted metal-sulfur cluster biosynthetic enzyme